MEDKLERDVLFLLIIILGIELLLDDKLNVLRIILVILAVVVKVLLDILEFVVSFEKLVLRLVVC